MFEVQDRPCATCIYRAGNPLDLNKLEACITDEHGFLNGYRICHHSETACCRGFWNRHKDDFQLGQVAQRLGMVKYVRHDTLQSLKEE